MFEEIGGKFRVVIGDGSLNHGMVGLVRLNNDVRDVEVATTDATDDLSK